LQVDACKETVMPEFCDIQNNAKDLVLLLSNKFTKQQGCLSVFSSLSLQFGNQGAFHDAILIGKVAQCLDSDFDEFLCAFLNKETNQTHELSKFKSLVLKGIYLLIGSRYNNSVSQYMNSTLVDLIQEHLNLKTMQDMDTELFNESLDALGVFSSFLFYNQKSHVLYSEIYSKLGETVHVDIYNLRQIGFVENDSIGNIYNGVMSYFGVI